MLKKMYIFCFIYLAMLMLVNMFVFADKTNNRGTVTIYVIDEETGELFNEDQKNFYIIGGGSVKNGLSGTICPGEWNSGRSNPHVFENLPNFQYSIHYIVSNYDNYNYEIDEDISEDSFDFSEGTEKSVRIYMKKFYWTINPTTATCRGDVDLNGLVELADLTVIAKYNRRKNYYADYQGSGCACAWIDRIQSTSDVHQRPDTAHYGRQEISYQQGYFPVTSPRKN